MKAPHPTLRIILNGSKANTPRLRSAVNALREDGVSVEVRVTWEAGDGFWMTLEAAKAGVDRVIAAGGDGTLHEVVNGVVEAADCDFGQGATIPAIGILPLGTANDFATACGIPLQDHTAALRLAATGTPTPVDVGCINDHRFINVASGGLGAEITARTPVTLKKLMGGAAYALMGLVTAHQLTPYHCCVTTTGPQGEETEEGEVVLLTVGNGRLAGGGHPVAPRALLNDGLLDVLTVRDVDPNNFPALLEEFLELPNGGGRYSHYRQVSSLTVETDRELQLNLDGEPLRDRRFEISVMPGRVSMVLPADCDLLRRH